MSKANEKELQGAPAPTTPEQEQPAPNTQKQEQPAPAAPEQEQPAPAAPEPYSAAWLEERVPINLLWDGRRYKDDVFVAVNGESCQIQRGKNVMIKRKFALALQDSMTQDAEAARVAAQFEGEYQSVKKALD